MAIALVPEILTTIGPVEITNSMVSAVFVFAVILLFCLYVKLAFRVYGANKFQHLVEYFILSFKGLTEDIVGKKAAFVFPFLFSFFIFIITSNFFGLLPFVGTVGFIKEPKDEHVERVNHVLVDLKTKLEVCVKGGCVVSYKQGGLNLFTDKELVPLFRAPTSDVSFTLALALISVVVTNILGIYFGRLNFIKRYIDFSSPLSFAIGFLEFILELGKVASFAFRLFGNIFAGEVLLFVITGLTFGLATLPFLGLEVFVGFIQAFVFFVLSAVFISLAIENH